MHPLDGGLDVKHAEVLSRFAGRELRSIGLTEDICPVVDRDNSKVIVVAHKVLAIVGWYVGLHSAERKSTTINPDHDCVLRRAYVHTSSIGKDQEFNSGRVKVLRA